MVTSDESENSSTDEHDSDDYTTDNSNSDEDPWGEDPDWVKKNKRQALGIKDEEEDDTKEEFKASAYHILILIDSNPTMFEMHILVDEEGGNDDKDLTSSSFNLALKAHEKLIYERISTVATYEKGK